MTLKVICTEGVVIEEDLLNKFTQAFKLISKEEDLDDNASVSYTHLTLPTNREV